jgi:hypothetical protein
LSVLQCWGSNPGPFTGRQMLNSTPSPNFFFLVVLGLKSGLQTCKAGALSLEPHLQSILLWLLWSKGLENDLLRLWTSILPISAFQVAMITSVSH